MADLDGLRARLARMVAQPRKDVDAPAPQVVVNIDMGDLIARMMSPRGDELQVAERVTPSVG